MKKYNLINNIFGWLSFAIAAVVYCMTIEPSASFWDCGEFITTAYKLEVGHPPGAPFFMLTAKFFSLFASDVTQVAAMINTMSAILSALTILFLFWTITHLAKKLIYTDNTKEMTLSQLIVIMGSGLVGALAYTFSDTFWFSAVEGEVYAYSSMFTALVFWLILKWENRADQPGSDKWLVIIAYAMGLSIGVHLLNLLCIPAIVLVYYYKKIEKPTTKGALLYLLFSFALIVILMYGIIPGFAKVGGWFELFFVNSLGFSYNIGALIYILLVVVSLVWGLFETFSQKGNLTRAKIAFIACATLTGVVFISSTPFLWLILFVGTIVLMFAYKGINIRLLNTSFLCLLVILIGYSSFALIPIRSAANPPMDQNSPEDAFSLAGYLNREQYGDSPLFHGRTYASEVVKENGAPKEVGKKDRYGKLVKKSETEKDKYIVEGTSYDYDYTKTMLFPRMHADKGQPGYDRYMRGYANWGGVTNSNVPPTMMQNLQFFFSYQLNFMYFRYFMWNFSGRQNDIQSTGGIANGNWITGIGFIDEHILQLGPQDDLPPDIADNKGHNKFYMLPLILGILGIVYQMTRGEKGKQQFFVTFMLFFMTGIAIVIYLNQKPYEPRERDYAYAGSFYAFAIWIGFGVAALWTLLKKWVPEMPSAVIASVACLAVPIQMVSQTWDDHDRSGRYVMRDVAMNYLDCCEDQAIIFTNGDNDTFPLWYIQEVEGYRTDVRVCNLGYLATDWYVDQMRRQSYESKPLPILWERDKYAGGNGSYAYVLTNKFIERVEMNRQGVDPNDMMARLQGMDFSRFYDKSAFKDTVSLNAVMDSLRTIGRYTPFNSLIDDAPIIPGNVLIMNIDTTKVDWTDLGTKPASEMIWNLGKDGVGAPRNELMVMEMISNINNDNWKRPVYFATTVGNDMYMGLRENFMLQGLTYRVTPGIIPNNGGVNTEVAYDNMVNKFRYRGINDPNVYLDETNLRTCKTYRMMFSELITALIVEGKNDKALKALDKCMEVVPGTTVPMGGESIIFGEQYYRLGEKEKARKVLDQISDRSIKTVDWLNRVKPSQMKYMGEEMKLHVNILFNILMTEQKGKDFEAYNSLVDKLLIYAPIYYTNGIVVYDSGGNPMRLGDYILANIVNTSLSNGYANREGVNDSLVQLTENTVLVKTMNAMKQYSPELYNQYNKQR